MSRACCYFLALNCVSWLSSGCIISPPDEQVPLPQIPPRINIDSVTPTPFAYVTTLTTGPAPSFTAEFVSEDLGVEVVGKLYLNLDDAGEALIGSTSMGAGSLDSVRPPMTIYWEGMRETAGCYAITMTITYGTNYDEERISKPVDHSKTAYVTWWVAHGIAPEDLNFESCPQPNPQPQ